MWEKQACLRFLGWLLAFNATTLLMDLEDSFTAADKFIFLFGVCVLTQPAAIYYPV